MRDTVEIEKTILLALISNQVQLSKARLTDSDFTDHANREVFRAVKKHTESGSKITSQSLILEAAKTVSIEAVVTAIRQIEMAFADDWVIDAACDELRKQGTNRRVRACCAEMVSRIDRDDVDDARGELLANVSSVTETATDRSITFGDSYFREVQETLGRYENGDLGAPCNPTGIVAIDRDVGGFPRGVVSVIAGRPRMGKSLMCMQTLLANALQGNGVHLFTLEDSAQAFSRRAMSRVAKVSVPDIMAMKFGEQQIATWRRSTPAFMKLKTLVDDTGGLTAREISSRILRHREANKTGMVIIDYIQRVGRDYKGQPEHEKIGDALDVWHAVAVRHGMSIVVCSQLNRDLEKRVDKRPQLSDMAESGRIEQYAKFIVAVHRGCVYGPPQDGIDYIGPGRKPSDDEWNKTMVFHVLKNSNGPCRAYETTANLEHMEIT